MSNLKSGGHLPSSNLGGETSTASPISVLVDSATQAALDGTNTANDPNAVAVNGNSPSGVGVHGKAMSGNGVKGESQSGDAVVGISQSNVHAGVSAQNGQSGPGLWAKGTPAGQFEGDVHVTGTLTVDNDIVLTNPGADFAEDFDLAVTAEGDPGSVMVLDDASALVPCREAYDRKVAGVISGAGTYRPGLVLDRRPAMHSRVTIALIGKVYCKVDATYGPIAVGDLLTTSATPGHAMKANDPARASGATIGKALAAAASGRALIPILVALQ
jgi:hypothetical protein